MFGVSRYQKRMSIWRITFSATTGIGSWSQRAERDLTDSSLTNRPALGLGPDCLEDRDSPCLSPRSAPLGQTGHKDGLRVFRAVH